MRVAAHGRAEPFQDEEAVKAIIFGGDTRGVLNFFLVRSRDSKQQGLGYGFGILATHDVLVRARRLCAPHNIRNEIIPFPPVGQRII